MSRHEGWILNINLRPCLELLAGVGEFELDEAALMACTASLPNTSASGEQWYSHALGRLELQLAQTEEGDRVALRVEAPHGYGRAVEAVIRACNSYLLQDAASSRAEADAIAVVPD